MSINSFEEIVKLDGLPFIKALLEFEEKRFNENFYNNSVYAEMSSDFGIFPVLKVYPIYFVGDVTKPKDKIIFIGINPGYSKDKSVEEQEYLEKEGSFSGYCNLFSKESGLRKSSIYFSNIGGFLRRIGWLEDKMSNEWLQENMINMDFIPYHSSNTNGLNINDPQKYKDRYFICITKIIKYLNPQKPIFINGFPTLAERYFSNEIFSDVIKFEKHGPISIGTIAGYKFIGVPFLTRVSGGKDELAKIVKKYL